jgi:MFS family permease
LGAAIFFAIAATNLLTPLLPSITSEFGVSYSAAGFLVSAYILARLVASVFVGRLSDLFGTVPLASMSLGILLVGSLVGMASPTIEVLLFSRLLAGAAVGIIATLALAALADLAPPRQRGHVMSLFQIAHNGGIALYPIVGGLIGLLAGWRATFVVMAFGAAICAWFLVPVLGRRQETEPETNAQTTDEVASNLSNTRRTVGLAAAYVGVFVTMFNRHGVRNTLLPLFGGTVLGLGPVAIASGVTVMSIIGLVIAMPGAMAGDRMGHRRLIVAGLAVLAVGDLLFIASGDYASFILASAVLGLGDFFIGSQTALLASLAPQGRRTQVLGGFRVATDAGALAGPIVLAGLMDALGPQAALVAAGTILATAALGSRLTLPTADHKNSLP